MLGEEGPLLCERCRQAATGDNPSLTASGEDKM